MYSSPGPLALRESFGKREELSRRSAAPKMESLAAKGKTGCGNCLFVKPNALSGKLYGIFFMCFEWKNIFLMVQQSLYARFDSIAMRLSVRTPHSLITVFPSVDVSGSFLCAESFRGQEKSEIDWRETFASSSLRASRQWFCGVVDYGLRVSESASHEGSRQYRHPEAEHFQLQRWVIDIVRRLAVHHHTGAALREHSIT